MGGKKQNKKSRVSCIAITGKDFRAGRCGGGGATGDIEKKTRQRSGGSFAPREKLCPPKNRDSMAGEKAKKMPGPN